MLRGQSEHVCTTSVACGILSIVKNITQYNMHRDAAVRDI